MVSRDLESIGTVIWEGTSNTLDVNYHFFFSFRRSAVPHFLPHLINILPAGIAYVTYYSTENTTEIGADQKIIAIDCGATIITL